MKSADALDTDNIRTGTLDISPHAVKEVGYIYNMRLPCSIFNNCSSLCHYRSKHNVDGCSDTCHIKEYMTAMQLFRLRNDQTIFNIHRCTQRLKALDMLVDRAASDITSTRKCHFSTLIFAKQCPQKIIGASDFLNIFIIYAQTSDRASIDLNRMTVHTVHHCSDAFDCLKQYIDIPHIRKILNYNNLICHYCSCHDTECRILGSANLDLADQWIAALNHILFHNAPLY